MSACPYAALSSTERRALLSRAGFPAEAAAALQAAYPWVAPVLFGLETLDASLAAEVRATGKTPVCGQGCSACCAQPVPVTPPEIMLIKLYLRHTVRVFPENTNSYVCPHLTRDGCAVYPVRPIACRRFIVFYRQCALGEGVLDVRPQDVLHPSRNSLLHALRSTLPYYAEAGLLPPDTQPDMTFFAGTTILLHNVDWQQGAPAPDMR